MFLVAFVASVTYYQNNGSLYFIMSQISWETKTAIPVARSSDCSRL